MMIEWPNKALSMVPVGGSSGWVPINTIKDYIRSILQTAKDSSSPISLSRNMVNAVSSVLTVNPEKLRPDANVFPCVTVFLSDKQIEAKTIAGNQVNGKRKAQLSFSIVGLMWNSNMVSYKQDPSDDDLEYLMENVEVVLRHYATLNNLCNWQIPTAVTYHSSGYDEQSHMRVGILNLDVTVYY